VGEWGQQHKDATCWSVLNYICKACLDEVRCCGEIIRRDPQEQFYSLYIVECVLFGASSLSFIVIWRDAGQGCRVCYI